MIQYEVNLEVSSEVASQFSEWLDPHIQDIIKLEGFIGVSWEEKEKNENDDENTVYWTVRYRLANRESLDSYFENHAQAFRQQCVDRFGDQFKATRQILRVMREY